MRTDAGHGNESHIPFLMGHIFVDDKDHTNDSGVERLQTDLGEDQDEKAKYQGKPIQGNLNSGYDYNNAGLSEADREALVEYMKGL